MLIFQFFDYCNRHVVIHVLVKALNDPGRQDADEACNRQPPDMPDHCETKQRCESCNDNARAAVFRHMNLFIASRFLIRFAFFFHFPERVTLVNDRNDSEVVERRRRRGCPLQRTAAPWVTGEVAVLLAIADRHVELNQLAEDTAGDQRRTAGCNNQHRMELRVNLLAQATGHTHEAQHVQRHKRHEETDDPEPESAFAPGFVQREAKGFRPPVGQTCEATEHHATDDDVMEVRDQEQAVVQHEVCARYRQQNAGHTAYGEGHDKANRPQHC